MRISLTAFPPAAPAPPRESPGETPAPLNASDELVSVVIPTRGRPALVTRAVESALAQTHTALEVLVVIDGPDAESRARLAGMRDSRLRLVQLAEPGGGARARNEGVRVARGRWIAFLDDDDRWAPTKVERQLATARTAPAAYPIVACRVRARTPAAEYTWPRRLPRPGEPIGDYLLARSSLFQGEGLVQTSMLLAPRELLQAVPFSDGLRRHHEWDWLLRALRAPNTALVFVDEPLAVWAVEDGRPSISRQNDWRYSLRWARERRDLLSARAFASFLLVYVASLAAREHDLRALPVLLREAVRGGGGRPIDYLVFAGLWLVPQRARRTLRRWLSGVGAA